MAGQAGNPQPLELAERTLAELRRAGADGEVHVTSVAGLRAEFASGKLRNCAAAGRLHLSVRVVRGGRVGFYATTDASDPALAVRRALAVADVGEELELAFPGRSDAAGAGAAAELAVFDQRVADLGAGGLVALAKDILGEVAAVTPGAEVQGGAERDVVETALANTAGATVRRRATRVGFGAEVARCRDEDVLAMWQSVESARLDDPELNGLAARLGQLYSGAARNVKLPGGGGGGGAAGKPRVVLAPEAAAVLIDPLLHGVDGMNANRGVTPLLGKQGQQILDAGFTLIDDPWLAWAPESALWDDEGTPTVRKALFEAGVFGTFLHDLRSAAQGGEGGRSTGNGRRGRGQPPRIGLFTLTLAPGKLPLPQLLAAAEGGLYVASVIGGAPGALAGAFSHPVGVAYLVKDGQLAGRVKDVAIAGNSYDVAKHGLVALEDRAHASGGMGGDMRMPHMLLEGVTIAGA
jgi:PmbA protein